MTAVLMFVAICGLGSAALGLWPYAKKNVPVPWGMVVSGLALVGFAFVELAGGSAILRMLLLAMVGCGNAYQLFRSRRDRT